MEVSPKPMTRLTSLAELGAWYGLDIPDESAVAEPSEAVNTIPMAERETADPEALLADLIVAAEQDDARRAADLAEYERYEALVATLRRVEGEHQHAVAMRERAETILGDAWTAELRAKAERAVDQLRREEETRAEHVANCRAAVEAVSAGLELERLRAERERQEQATREKAASAERAKRLSSALAAARAALVAGSFQEAKTLAGAVASENPDNAEAASLIQIIERRWLAVKVADAEGTLRESRRLLRRQPDAAIDLLTALDVVGLPDSLGGQIFGAWAQACARLCRERDLTDPLRYAPDRGRGAILVRDDATDGYRVISALGMGAEWQPDTVVAGERVRLARPLVAR